MTMDASTTLKSKRAFQLLATLTSRTWTNAEFWEAQRIIRSPDGCGTSYVINQLNNVWRALEADRIATGEHLPCDTQLERALDERWPREPQPTRTVESSWSDIWY